MVPDYKLENRSSISDRGKGFFSLASVTRPALRPTQSSIQWVPGVKHDRTVMLTTEPDLVPWSRMRSYTSFPFSRLHGGSGTALLLLCVNTNTGVEHRIRHRKAVIQPTNAACCIASTLTGRSTFSLARCSIVWKLIFRLGRCSRGVLPFFVISGGWRALL
jgi:hypothetical protein